MKVEVTVDASEFERKMADLPACLARARRRALLDAGTAVKSRAERTFKEPGMRPSPWAPRKGNADPSRPLLQKSGVMKRDLSARLEGDDTVVVGTPHEYIRYHQFGTRRMPARPVLPLDRHGNLLPETMRKVMGKVKKAFREELEKL